jgi:hypothetical protein
MIKYELQVVNPRTNEQRKLQIDITADRVAAAASARCLDQFIWLTVLPDIPEGFLILGNSAHPVTLQ